MWNQCNNTFVQVSPPNSKTLFLLFLFHYSSTLLDPPPLYFFVLHYPPLKSSSTQLNPTLKHFYSFPFSLQLDFTLPTFTLLLSTPLPSTQIQLDATQPNSKTLFLLFLFHYSSTLLDPPPLYFFVLHYPPLNSTQLQHTYLSPLPLQLNLTPLTSTTLDLTLLSSTQLKPTLKHFFVSFTITAQLDSTNFDNSRPYSIKLDSTQPNSNTLFHLLYHYSSTGLDSPRLP